MDFRSTAALLLTGTLLLAGCGASRAPLVVVKAPPSVPLEAPPLQWNLPAPAGAPLVFEGVVDMDDAGLGMGAPLYPGGDAATFLAAVFTHAAIADAARDEQKAKLQAQADKVLAPYLPYLQELQYADVMRAAAAQMTVEGEKRLVEVTDVSHSGWLATIEPVFRMAQDERAVLLEGVITLFSPEDREAPYYRNLVRIVSPAVVSRDPRAYWLEGDGERLREQLVSLLARGLDVAITDATVRRTDGTTSSQTFRYMEGSVERIERAQLLERTCKRMLLKTLRGHLYLVPAPAPTKSTNLVLAETCTGQDPRAAITG